MAYRDLEPVSKQLTIVVGLTVVGFMAFGLALSFYRNVLFEETLKKINEQNAALGAKRDQSYQDLEYYQSAQYKDKYAKENLNKFMRGEKVLFITARSDRDDLPGIPEEDPTAEQEAVFEEYLRQMPVFDHWKLYLFNREKIDQLKKSL